MASLSYVGAAPSAGREITTKADTEGILNSGVSRGYVTGRVATLAAGKATKVYVDNQDATFAAPSYYTTQDALLVPNSAKGAANGVAALDGTGKIPSVNVPILGAGIIRGPFAHTQGYAGTASVTPLKIADFPGGVLGVNCQLMCFMTVIVVADAPAKPVVEVRYSTAGGTTYASQTLLARGNGRSYFADAQTITVEPVTALAGEGQDGVQDSISSAANLTINAWLYDGGGASGQVSTQVGYIVSSALYLARTLL